MSPARTPHPLGPLPVARLPQRPTQDARSRYPHRAVHTKLRAASPAAAWKPPRRVAPPSRSSYGAAGSPPATSSPRPAGGRDPSGAASAFFLAAWRVSGKGSGNPWGVLVPSGGHGWACGGATPASRTPSRRVLPGLARRDDALRL